VETSARARRKNGDIPRNLHNLNFSESFHWLIAKTQIQDPIISPQICETAISGKRGENANSTVRDLEIGNKRLTQCNRKRIDNTQRNAAPVPLTLT
jgi:hypothetical protein